MPRADSRTSAIDIVVEVKDAQVTLRGIVVDEQERALCREVVSRLPGVRGVAEELRTMAGGLYRFPSQPRG